MSEIISKLTTLKFESCEEVYIGARVIDSLFFGDCGAGAPGKANALKEESGKTKKNILTKVENTK